MHCFATMWEGKNGLLGAKLIVIAKKNDGRMPRNTQSYFS